MTDPKEWGRSAVGELTERWPRNENGEPEEPVLLTTARNLNFFDEMTVNMLEAYGIPCIRRYPGNGSFGKLILGVSGQGTEIYVPRSLLEDAQALCAQTEEPEEES